MLNETNDEGDRQQLDKGDRRTACSSGDIYYFRRLVFLADPSASRLSVERPTCACGRRNTAGSSVRQSKRLKGISSANGQGLGFYFLFFVVGLAPVGDLDSVSGVICCLGDDFRGGGMLAGLRCGGSGMLVSLGCGGGRWCPMTAFW
nr:hypothetical protein Iba_chr15dCG8330 [Ipomoea batatas]